MVSVSQVGRIIKNQQQNLYQSDSRNKKMSTKNLLSSLQNINKIMNSSLNTNQGEGNSSPMYHETDNVFENINHQQYCNDDLCLHCHQLNSKLLSAQLKYNRLKTQNYVGQLTIHFLKQKNKELLHKICRGTGHNQIELNCDKQNVQENQNWENKCASDKQVLLETFNPAHLRKVLSETQNIMPAQSEYPDRTTASPSKRSVEDGRSYRKQFNLSELTRRAKQRLQNKPIVKKKVTFPIAHQQNKQNLEFKFY